MKKSNEATIFRPGQEGLPLPKAEDSAEAPADYGDGEAGARTFIQISEQTVWDISIVDAQGDEHSFSSPGSTGVAPGGSQLDTTIRVLEFALATLRQKARDGNRRLLDPVR